jgi:hypothetical protein
VELSGERGSEIAGRDAKRKQSFLFESLSG